jgi:hypothetical protein
MYIRVLVGSWEEIEDAGINPAFDIAEVCGDKVLCW